VQKSMRQRKKDRKRKREEENPTPEDAKDVAAKATAEWRQQQVDRISKKERKEAAARERAQKKAEKNELKPAQCATAEAYIQEDHFASKRKKPKADMQDKKEPKLNAKGQIWITKANKVPKEYKNKKLRPKQIFTAGRPKCLVDMSRLQLIMEDKKISKH